MIGWSALIPVICITVMEVIKSLSVIYAMAIYHSADLAFVEFTAVISLQSWPWHWMSVELDLAMELWQCFCSSVGLFTHFRHFYASNHPATHLQTACITLTTSCGHRGTSCGHRPINIPSAWSAWSPHIASLQLITHCTSYGRMALCNSVCWTVPRAGQYDKAARWKLFVFKNKALRETSRERGASWDTVALTPNRNTPYLQLEVCTILLPTRS